MTSCAFASSEIRDAFLASGVLAHNSGDCSRDQRLRLPTAMGDEPELRDFVKNALEPAGFAVSTADHGKVALQSVAIQRPDLVVLDLNMPDIDGPEILKQLRERWASLPILIFTGFPDGALMSRALESGPFTLLAKPCNSDELVATVRMVKKQEETSFWRMESSRRSDAVVSFDHVSTKTETTCSRSH